MRYTFGTSELAAQRLKSIGDFFNPLAQEFITEYLQPPAEIALDLGCGPGYTTRMLAEATHAKNVYGCDLSDDFLAGARTLFPECQFIKHDVTQTPFPVKAGVIYARFILAHLKDICPIIERWVGELEAGGTLFIEEVEEIFTENPLFKKYLDVNEGLISTQGAVLFAGRIMRNCTSRYKVLLNEAVLLPVPDWQAANWFYPNTETIWKTEEYVRGRIPEQERLAVAAGLKALIQRPTAQSGITWQMRRVVIRKTPV